MRRPLRCYLLRTGAAPLTSLTQGPGVELAAYKATRGEFERVESLNDFGETGDTPADDMLVVLVSSFAAPPWWQELLEDELPIENFALPPIPSKGALIFCATEDPAQAGRTRWVVWTFGNAWRCLDRKALEPRFGVISALNRIIGDESQYPLLRRLQYSQQGAYRQRTGHVAFEDTPLTGFRMDQVRDLLGAVGGTPSDGEAQVFGARNLTFRTDVDDLSTLSEQASVVLADYRSDAYKQDFSFIDDYIPVEDPHLTEDLDNATKQAALQSSDRVDLALPLDIEDFSDDRAIELILLPGEHLSTAARTVLTLDRIARGMAEEELELDSELRFADSSGNLLGRAPLKDCLSADLSLENERFVLADGAYYQVRDEFIDAVDDELEGIGHWAHHFPRYAGGSERAWLEQAAQVGEYTLLDGWVVKLPGRTSVEAADLVHSSGALVHAKRKGRSSALSYLFVQASASSQLLSEYPEAVAQFRSKVEEAAPDLIKDSTVEALEALEGNRPGLEVVLAILGDWNGKDVTNLPLVAKLDLRASVQSVQQRGFQPCLALVNLKSRP